MFKAQKYLGMGSFSGEFSVKGFLVESPNTFLWDLIFAPFQSCIPVTKLQRMPLGFIGELGKWGLLYWCN